MFLKYLTIDDNLNNGILYGPSTFSSEHFPRFSMYLVVGEVDRA